MSGVRRSMIRSRRGFVIVALLVALGLATAASPFASSTPDGLERVAGDQAFLDDGRAQRAPAPGYAFPGVDDPRMATGLAGLAGTLIVFGAGLGAARMGRRHGA